MVQRLVHIVELEEILEQCLEVFPAFKVPHYVFWSDPKKSQILLNKKKKVTRKVFLNLSASFHPLLAVDFVLSNMF